MSFAHVQNADKIAFIEPTLDSISAASAAAADSLPASEESWVNVSLVNVPGPDSYPIASFTYLLVYDDLKPVTNSKEQAKALIHLIHWMITDGQKFSPSLLYVPLSDGVAELGKQGLSKVTYDGEQLWDYVESTKADGLGIPNWIRDNAKWWSEGLITDEEYINGLQFLIKEGILKV